MFFPAVLAAIGDQAHSSGGTVRCSDRILPVSSVTVPFPLAAEFMKEVSCCKLSSSACASCNCPCNVSRCAVSSACSVCLAV